MPDTPSKLAVRPVNTVSQTSYRNYLDNLLYTRTGDSRGLTGAQHDLAQANILNELTSFGLQTYLDPFTYTNNTYYNVIGVLPGTTARSNEIYIVGAHYDSTGNPSFPMPGADDNASGVAAVLEAARVLSKFRFEATLVFAAFDREEQHKIGSTAYALNHQYDNIRGMVSLDMIAFNDPDPKSHNAAWLFGREASSGITTDMKNAINLYSPSITVWGGYGSTSSDHFPFEELGFQACMFTEGGYNPKKHHPTDTVDTPNYIDYEYATQFTRSTVGYLATSAGVVSIPEPSSWLLVLLGIVLLVRRR